MSPDFLRPQNDEQLTDALQRRVDMIRYRGIEEYSTCLGLSIEDLATQKVREKGSFQWYDMCCGDFLAADALLGNLYSRSEFAKDVVRPNVYATGVDLDTLLGEDRQLSRNVVIRKGNAATYPIPPGTDLLTCYRGLMYIEEYLGKGLETIENWYNSLPTGATLALDLSCHPRLEYPRVTDFLQNRFGKEAVKINADYINNWQALAFKVVKPDNQRLQIPR